MQLANLTTRLPHLVEVLETLSKQKDQQEAAQSLITELSDITVLVAKRFTNDRTADGILEAFYLTVGCLSLAICQANIPETTESRLTFLLHHGAEHVFQMGFRMIKELSGMPYDAFVSDFDNDPFIQQRNIKLLFSEICRAEPISSWSGEDTYNKEKLDRGRNQSIVDCAKWLRKNHFSGPVKSADLDANAVIALTIIFALSNDGRIVARTGQKEIENLVLRARKSQPDIELCWDKLLKIIPAEYRPILRERMDEYKNTIIKKILSKTRLKTVISEMQDYYAGSELDIDYP
jgi:hypothetical protein